jgi:hypothetical protein
MSCKILNDCFHWEREVPAEPPLYERFGSSLALPARQSNCEKALANCRRRDVSSPANPRELRHGFTLFEVLVSLTLTTLVLVIIGIAVDFHLRVVESGRTRVEEAQLARALLHRMAEDIRSAMRYDPMDIEKLAGAINTSGQIGEAMDLFGDDVEEADLDDLATDLEDLSDSMYSQSMPGLYGTTDWLQVDVSRPLRLEQFAAMFDAETELEYTAPVGDIRSIVYYLAGSESAPAASYAATDDEALGVMRRELDRAIADFAADQGWLEQVETAAEPLAPEVTDLAFQYFNGYEWTEYWDSEEMDGLPLAVEIAIMLNPASNQEDQASAWLSSDGSSGSRDIQPMAFRLVVHLPAAEPATEIEGTDDFLEEESADSPGDEGTGQPPGGGSGGVSAGGGGQSAGGVSGPSPSGGGQGR